GDQLGRYRLVESLGEGGGGAVYVAEQEEPVRRQVALKIIKLGMDTRRVISRFEAERQTLAMMDHPHIAKVYDAGATETGRPYFVMELVRGMHLTRYCDHYRLATMQRLGLFVEVCRAIHHAHQKGIIHRDIKPSNILVTRMEAEQTGILKVIDFGIAKATEEAARGDTATGPNQPLGTPAYMSPEQAAGTDLDTRSDIYALGVVLYELLSGRLPFDSDRTLAGGSEALRRQIREEEPPRPSTRLSTLTAADITRIAQQRNTDAARLAGLLRGDLDWIVMKALEKDRARRYESAAGLADDIQRHLQHEPVVACPPTKLYQFRKFTRRHRAAFLAASGVAAALVAGVLVSTILAVRATRAEREQRTLREQAEQARAGESRQRQRSDQVAHFLEEMLKGVGPSVALGRDTQMLREILDKTVVNLPVELKNQPDVEADLRQTIGEVYEGLGQLEQAET
ncbi:MAG TPA: protein kinase, partial [Candidatus Dormibacteraeota bacterium]|nr:protein kinase [Candidatus Dormibacteraeota bacterium]